VFESYESTDFFIEREFISNSGVHRQLYPSKCLMRGRNDVDF